MKMFKKKWEPLNRGIIGPEKIAHDFALVQPTQKISVVLVIAPPLPVIVVYKDYE